MPKRSSAIEGLIRDIKKLRGHRGYLMSKLRDCDSILNQPTVRQAGPTEEDRIVAATGLLFDALDELSGDDAVVARAMLGIGAITGPTLQYRLTQLGGSLQTTYDRMDVVTLELAHQLYRLGRARPRAAPFARPVLRHARDVRLHYRLQPLVEGYARLNGLIVRVNRRYSDKILFMRLRDTDFIQLMARREDFDDHAWTAIRALREGVRVTATGRVGASDSGEPSVILDRPPLVREKTLDFSIAQGEDDYARIGAQILGARLRHRTAGFFRSEEFVEIEPSLFSASRRASGLEPLRVHYPGFGTAAYLEPSPAPQLLDALVATGLDRVFAVSRCFSTTYRDEKSSDQSLILVAKALDLSGDALRTTMQRAVAATLGDLETFPDETDPHLVLTAWNQDVRPWPPEPGAIVRSKPTIEIFSPLPDLAPRGHPAVVTEIFRGVWPPSTVIGEGAQELVDGKLAVSTITLHLERMISLLRELPLRQLRLRTERTRPHEAARAETS